MLPAEHSDSRMTRYEHKREFSGAMEELSGKVQNAMTHAVSLVRVDVAVVERHCSTIDANAATL